MFAMRAEPLIAIIGNIGFVHDGETLYVRVIVPGRRAVHVGAEHTRLQINRLQRERGARKRLAREAIS